MSVKDGYINMSSITRRILITSFVLAIVAAGGAFWFTTRNGSGDESLKANEYLIRFEELDETIYIRARSWGLGGNHQEIIISTSPILNGHLEYFKDSQFTYFYSTELYYKKVGSDGLEIFVDSTIEVPKAFSSKVRVKQIELSFDEATDYKQHYQEYGLSKVSV